MFSLHVCVCIPAVCSCGQAGGEGHVIPRWATAVGKSAAGVALRDEKCPGSSGVFLLHLLLVSLTSSLFPLEAHASFSTSTLPFVL